LALLIQDWLGPDNVKAVAQGNTVAQRRDDNVRQTAPGLGLGLQRFAERDRVGDAVAGVKVNNQVLLVPVGQGGGSRVDS
jgi:hypothetical protein